MVKASAVSGVVVAPLRRRRWTVQQKRRIVEQTLAPGASIARVARDNDVNANQVHTWRRLYRSGLLGGVSESATLLPVKVVRGEGPLPVAPVFAGAPAAGQSGRLRRTRPLGAIQIEMQRGRLRIEGAADPLSLRIALECLLA